MNDSVLYPAVKVSRHIFEWIIENPENLENGHLGANTHKSPVLSGPNETKWFLTFSPFGLTSEDQSNGYVSFAVILEEAADDRQIVLASCNITIKGTKNAVDLNKEIPTIGFKANETYDRGRKAGVPSMRYLHTFAKRSIIFNESGGYLVDGKMTVHCELAYITDGIHLFSNEPKTTLRRLNALNRLDQLLEFDDFYADFVIVCSDGREVRAHKALLASQSPVFDRMFKSGMTEAKTGRVTIDDLSSDVMLELVRYARSSKVGNLDSLAVAELLYAAIKYDMLELKEICIEQLSQISSLTTENACLLLILSDSHQIDPLKRRATEFISQFLEHNDPQTLNNWMMLEHSGLASQFVSQNIAF